MPSQTAHLPASANEALKQLTSALRAKGYKESEIQELVFGAQEFIEARLDEHSNADGLDFSDIVANFSTPDLDPETDENHQKFGVSGNIALGVSLVALVLFAVIPFAVPESSGGAALVSVALIGAPAAAILGWLSRDQATGKAALILATLPFILLAAFVLIERFG